jgi:hypothetical protein
MAMHVDPLRNKTDSPEQKISDKLARIRKRGKKRDRGPTRKTIKMLQDVERLYWNSKAIGKKTGYKEICEELGYSLDAFKGASQSYPDLRARIYEGFISEIDSSASKLAHLAARKSIEKLAAMSITADQRLEEVLIDTSQPGGVTLRAVEHIHESIGIGAKGPDLAAPTFGLSDPEKKLMTDMLGVVLNAQKQLSDTPTITVEAEMVEE